MAFAHWMRVLDAVGGLAQLSGRFRRPAASAMEPSLPGGGFGGGSLAQLESRLAGVLVAALKEAFDRDAARMDLERTHLEAERKRAEDALRAELRRQAGERALSQLRLLAIMAMSTWALTAGLAVWLPGMGDGAAPILLGGGWILAIGALGFAFAGWQHVSAWSADPTSGRGAAPAHLAVALAPWCLVGSLLLSGSSLLLALLR